MFIKSLFIKNFRCFGREGIKINFNDKDNITAFIGKNGSGKTTILEALNFLIGSEYLPTKINEKDFHSEAKSTKEEDAIIIEGETIKPFFIDLDVISNKNIPSTIVVPCNKIRLFIKRRERAEKKLDDPLRIEKTVIPILGDIDESIYKNQDFKKSYKIIELNKVDSGINDLNTAKEIIKNLLKNQTINIQNIDNFYIARFKLKSGEIREASFPNYSLNFYPNRIKGLAKSYYLSKDRDNDITGNYSFISKILTDFHWKYKKEQLNNEKIILEKYKNFSDLLRQIVDEKNQLINEINDLVKKICSDNINFQIDFVDIDQPYKSAFITKKVNDKLLLSENLGSGFEILIAFALFSYVAKKEEIPIVLIIDEPELHLHSDWQKKMYEVFVKESKLQFVYSTQSENFISLKNWRQIRSLSNLQVFPKEEILNEKIKTTDNQQNKSGKIFEYLNDYADKNLHISLILRENLELFFTKKCILVEGPTEKYALPKLLKLNGCNIEDYSISIIPTWGKTKIKNYQLICKAFGIDYFTIYDKDKKEDNEKENENISIENNIQNGNGIGFSTSFELLMEIAGDKKFQKLVKKIDEIKDISSLNKEIKECIKNLKKFIINTNK